MSTEPTTTTEQVSSLGRYIKQQLRRLRDDQGRPWTQNELARRAKMSSGAISLLMRGETIPETGTLQKVADALGVPFSELLAAQTGEIQDALDPGVAYFARRLNELPPSLREHALEIVGEVVDTFTKIARGEPANGHTDGPEALRALFEGYPDAPIEMLSALLDDLAPDLREQVVKSLHKRKRPPGGGGEEDDDGEEGQGKADH